MGATIESVVPGWVVAAVAWSRTGTPPTPTVNELNVPLPAFDPYEKPLEVLIQHNALVH